MKILYGILFIVGIIFCIVAVMGHNAAWVAAALSFFAATMIAVNRRKQ